MKTLHLSIIVICVLAGISSAGIGASYAYSSVGIPETHYPPTNDTKLELLVMNSTEFKERITGYNYTLAGIDYNWIPKANNYYDLGGARVTFTVCCFANGTVKGVAFNLDPQLKIKSIFEYDAENPLSGYYSDTCHGCFLVALNSTKPLVEPKNVMESPLKQLESRIIAADVKCNRGLQLIFKVEDGFPACVTIETGKDLVKRGWAKTFGTGISTNDYYTTCDTPYPKSNTGVAVLYMPVNSIGKICVRYYNGNDFSLPISQLRIPDPNNNNQNATNITIWSDLVNNTISKGNFTAVYWIKTGNQTGFYGLTVSSCIWTPFAVGYDNNSKIVASDFPFVGVTVSCPAGILSPEIYSMSGIGVKYIPYP
ncbi:MAG TPA: hypothetical protein VGR54_02495 [Nitrosopumilaceae archaeon]|nr:hypothetical protein [Nitrosopumilaceae archaeon]